MHQQCTSVGSGRGLPVPASKSKALAILRLWRQSFCDQHCAPCPSRPSRPSYRHGCYGATGERGATATTRTASRVDVPQLSSLVATGVLDPLAEGLARTRGPVHLEVLGEVGLGNPGTSRWNYQSGLYHELNERLSKSLHKYADLFERRLGHGPADRANTIQHHQ